MSGTVKLIIDIDEDTYKYLKNISGHTAYRPFEIIANGIPLDSVRAEIQTRHDSIQRNIQYDNGRIDALEWVLDVLDNVGSEVKPDE